jgi:protein-S-isoprenylcysteine O-methyltransferase Ste14
MLIGWGYLLPSGAIFARFFKHRPNGLWFQIHRGLQITGLILAIAGWIVALTSFTSLLDKPLNNYRHACLGMTTMILGLIQPLNAIVRPYPPREGEDPTMARCTWEIVHKGLGYISLILAVVTIGYGTTLLPKLEQQRAFQYAYGIGAGGIILLLLIGLNMDKSKYTAVATSKDDVPEQKQHKEDVEK